MHYRNFQRVVDGHGKNVYLISLIHCPEEYRTIKTNKKLNNGIQWNIGAMDGSIKVRNASDDISYFSPLGLTGCKLNGRWTHSRSILRLVKPFSEQGVPFAI
ncbi:MAG: hypothetical protein EB127_20280 [Alphaproteobacteria bacterium]|nr:hypothetical protein [Alphaproteobacteria bacterium]